MGLINLKKRYHLIPGSATKERLQRILFSPEEGRGEGGENNQTHTYSLWEEGSRALKKTLLELTKGGSAITFPS